MVCRLRCIGTIYLKLFGRVIEHSNIYLDIQSYMLPLSGKIILIVKSSLNKSLRKEFERTGILNAVNKEHGR